MNHPNLKEIIEVAIFAAGEPISIERLQQLFDPELKPTAKEIQEAITGIREDYHSRPLELIEVASGYRFQAKRTYATWLQRLWEKKPIRYSRALLETLALVAYQQPITRGEIEDVRGVAISANIMKTLQEREWVKVVGHKDVPGKPALYGTTREFLDYFNLKSLAELPSLQELMNLEQVEQKLHQQFALDVGSLEQAAAMAEKEFIEMLPEESALADEETSVSSPEAAEHDFADELSVADYEAEELVMDKDDLRLREN